MVIGFFVDVDLIQPLGSRWFVTLQLAAPELTAANLTAAHLTVVQLTVTRLQPPMIT